MILHHSNDIRVSVIQWVRLAGINGTVFPWPTWHTYFLVDAILQFYCVALPHFGYDWDFFFYFYLQNALPFKNLEVLLVRIPFYCIWNFARFSYTDTSSAQEHISPRKCLVLRGTPTPDTQSSVLRHYLLTYPAQSNKLQPEAKKKSI